MRVFLSAFSGFTLAVPMNAVGAMMLYDQETEETIHYDQVKRSTYISLPRLFNLPNEIVHHGIILREWNSKANKVVLLTAEVKRDVEIPDEQFYPIPKTFGALRFSEMFSGIHFSGNPILLLNIEQLAQSLQKHQRVDLDEKNNLPEQPSPAETSELSSPAPESEIQLDEKNNLPEQPSSAEPSESSSPAPESESQPDIEEDQQANNEKNNLPEQSSPAEFSEPSSPAPESESKSDIEKNQQANNEKNNLPEQSSPAEFSEPSSPAPESESQLDEKNNLPEQPSSVEPSEPSSPASESESQPDIEK
jgi:chemotaxis protein histidine kinase CheA